MEIQLVADKEADIVGLAEAIRDQMRRNQNRISKLVSNIIIIIFRSLST